MTVYLLGILVAWVICVIGSCIEERALKVKAFAPNCAMFFSWVAVVLILFVGIAILSEKIDWDEIGDKRIL